MADRVRQSLRLRRAIPGGPIAAFFPLPEFWPALCVMNDDDYPAAMDLLRGGGDAEATTQAEWTCPQCGESVPAHFAACWSCGHSVNP